MTGAWKQWEGQVVNGEFYLRQYLGGSENSAVFLADQSEREPQKAAIKLLLAPQEISGLQLSQWERVAKLSHPHLIRLFQMGRCQLGNMGLLYVVMEYAEENLSQILPDRPLTPAEAREMLEPALDALAYVHGEGFLHGHIKPANIMAVEDQVKISSDGLCRMYESTGGLGKPSIYDAPEMAGGEVSPAADVWSLGMTLVEALTQRLPVWEGPEQGEPVLPETLPAPFLELARHCLRWDLQRRWRVADLVAHLRQSSPAPQGQTAASPQSAFAKWRYVVPAVALGLVLAAVLVVPRLFNSERTPSTVVEQPGVQPKSARKAATREAGQPMQRTKKQSSPHAAPGDTPVQSATEPPTPTVGLVPGKVVHQVLPEVPRKARDTIRGKVRVGVRVRVDPSGDVSGANLDSPGPSTYFAQLSLKAARRWKFDPAKVDARNVSSEWILRFEFGKTGTKVLSVQAAP
jgi:TonB family protein